MYTVYMGVQYGGLLNRRVCVGSVESLDLGKSEMESSPGKVMKGLRFDNGHANPMAKIVTTQNPVFSYTIIM